MKAHSLLVRSHRFPIAPCLPCAGRPQHPDNKDRLEKQTDKPRKVGVQPKCVNPVKVLRDISRKDQYKKCCGNPAGNHPISAMQDYQSHPQNDLDNPRDEHNQITVDWQPGWNLGQEILPSTHSDGQNLLKLKSLRVICRKSIVWD